MSLAKINSNIAKVRSMGVEYNDFIHDTAMLIVKHAAPASLGGHGDCSPAQDLVNAMPASMRRSMLVLWFSTFTPIVTKFDDDKWTSKMHKVGSKMYVEWDIDGASKTPFYVLAEKNPEKKQLDLLGILNLVSRLSKTIDKKVEDGLIAEGDVEFAQLVSKTIAGLRFNPIAAKPAADDDTVGKVLGVAADDTVAALPKLAAVG